MKLGVRLIPWRLFELKSLLWAVTSNSNEKETACVSQTSLNLIRNEVSRGVDSLEAIRAIEFNVGWTSNSNEKKTARGRPKKIFTGCFTSCCFKFCISKKLSYDYS